MEKSRNALGFESSVREAFRFLNDFGFQEVGAEDTIVRYATDRVFLNVYHGRASFELGIEVGIIGAGTDDSRGHSLSEFMRLVNPIGAEGFRNFCATTPEELKVGLERLVAMVTKYVSRALRGDDTIFVDLERKREEWASAFAADVAYQQVSPKAAEAFRQRNYAQAVELYESVRAKLTPAELTKLEYAKTHR